MTNLWKSLSLAGIVSCLLLSTTSFAQPKEVVVKLGTVAPTGTPWSDVLEKLKKRVKEESGGSIKVKGFFGGQLGGEIEMTGGIRRGRIEGGGITSGGLSTAVPELEVLEIPYIFDSNEQVDCVLDTKLLSDFQRLFEQKDLIFVSWVENGWRSMGTKSKLAKVPADLKGVKIRAQEAKVHLAYWNKIGASAVPIAIPEVLPALQTGVVDGFDNTPLFTMAADWSSTIKYYSITRHIYQPAAMVFSKKFWGTINDDQRKILMGPGNGMAGEARKEIRKLDGRLISILKSKDIEVYTPNKGELDQWKAAAIGVAEDAIPKLGGETKKVYAAVLDAKNSCK